MPEATNENIVKCESWEHNCLEKILYFCIIYSGGKYCDLLEEREFITVLTKSIFKFLNNHVSEMYKAIFMKIQSHFIYFYYYWMNCFY